MTTSTTGLKMYLKIRDQVISGDKVALDEFGVGATFTDLEGWWEPPSTTSSVMQRSYAHGVYANNAYQTERNIVVNGEMFAPTRVALRKGLERLAASIPITTFEPFIVFEDGLLRHVMARQGGQTMIDWQGHMNTETGELEATFSFQLICANPLRLSGDGSGPTKVRATPPGVNPSALQIFNNGTGLTPPTVVKFTGCTNPTVSVNGNPLTFMVAVPTGALLVVDFYRKTVAINGVDQYTQKVGEWPKLNSDVNSFTFSAASVEPTGQMIVETYDSDL